MCQKARPAGLGLVNAGTQASFSPFDFPMTVFLISLLVLSAAAVLVTVRAVAQARDGFEDAAGFQGEAPEAVRPPRETLPTLGSRPAGLAS